MTNCELCKSTATVYCESDQASLCWNCDGKVHGANFLVARHSRNLLCHACQSPTPWKAYGPRLGHTVSLCECCVYGVKRIGEDDGEEGEGEVPINGANVIDGKAEDDHENETDAGENHGVPPWSFTQMPPAASPSSSEESVTRFFGESSRNVAHTSKRFSLKRMREDLKCSSTQWNRDSEVSEGKAAPLRQLKDRKVEKERPARNEDGSGYMMKNPVEPVQHHRGIDLNALPESSSLSM